MKKFVVVLVGSALLFTGCGSESKPSTPTPDVAQDMTQFNADLSAYMTSEVRDHVDSRVTVTADCDPIGNAPATHCQLTLTGIGNQVDHNTLENVRRTGANFDWDQKSKSF